MQSDGFIGALTDKIEEEVDVVKDLCEAVADKIEDVKGEEE